MSELANAADRLSRRERHTLAVGCGKARDAAVASGRAAEAELWSAVLCEVAAAADRERETFARFEDDLYR